MNIKYLLYFRYWSLPARKKARGFSDNHTSKCEIGAEVIAVKNVELMLGAGELILGAFAQWKIRKVIVTLS